MIFGREPAGHAVGYLKVRPFWPPFSAGPSALEPVGSG